MKYTVTTLFNNDYCQLAPNDPTCHRTQVVKAASKIEAIMQVHEDSGFVQNNKETHNILPIVWEVV